MNLNQYATNGRIDYITDQSLSNTAMYELLKHLDNELTRVEIRRVSNIKEMISHGILVVFVTQEHERLDFKAKLLTKIGLNYVTVIIPIVNFAINAPNYNTRDYKLSRDELFVTKFNEHKAKELFDASQEPKMLKIAIGKGGYFTGEAGIRLLCANRMIEVVFSHVSNTQDIKFETTEKRAAEIKYVTEVELMKTSQVYTADEYLNLSPFEKIFSTRSEEIYYCYLNEKEATQQANEAKKIYNEIWGVISYIIIKMMIIIMSIIVTVLASTNLVEREVTINSLGRMLKSIGLVS